MYNFSKNKEVIVRFPIKCLAKNMSLKCLKLKAHQQYNSMLQADSPILNATSI